jgi:lipopolysaccharide export system protein LptA
MNRKKKLKITQISLLILGTLIIFFTYSDKKSPLEEKIVTKENQEKIKNQLSDQSQAGDIFYNIEYSGLDLAGNRYILRSKEAYTEKKIQEIVNMKSVEAIFYFKDNTVLEVWSNQGIYNNKTLNMIFEGNVKGIYEESELFAERAEYSNSNGFLTISNNVKIKDIKGTMVADKLLFDIKKQKLNIASFNNGKINANINLK